MEIDSRKVGQTAIVSVKGRIDTLSAPRFQERIQEILTGGEKSIVLDMAGVEYVSSAGLRSILIGARIAKSEQVCLSCCALQAMVRKVFEISGFDSMIPLYENVDAALKG